MGGEECFQELKQIKDDVRVILSSGYDEEHTTNRFPGSGLRGFLQKPFNEKELMVELRRALEAEEGGERDLTAGSSAPLRGGVLSWSGVSRSGEAPSHEPTFSHSRRRSDSGQRSSMNWRVL